MDSLLKAALILICFFFFVFISKNIIRSYRDRRPLEDDETTQYKGRNVFERSGPGKVFDPDKEGYSEDASFTSTDGPDKT
jgi:hypothetical protein